MKTSAVLLGVLGLAFAARVLGQFLVARFGVSWLPPMSEWHSGLLPYGVLLSAQVAILAVQFEVSRQLWLGRGPFARRNGRVGRFLAWFSLVYFAVMAARYVITMALYPDMRWTGGAIPIAFHFVLAGSLYVYSRHLRGLPPHARMAGGPLR